MKSFLEKLEANSKTHKPVVMAFGRMNPPTTGHEKLVNRVKELAKDYGAPHHVIISHSVDAKKNPLDINSKVKHAQRFFPNTNIEASSKELPTFLQHAARLHTMGHDHLIMVAGSDRIPEYEKKLQQYNGTAKGSLYNFKKIEVKSAGQRDPDSEGTEGMSASKMREHAQNNDFNSFKQGIPSHVPEKHAKELFRDVRQGMGIHESANHGLFKAIFISGGPGSGKDIIIREAIAQQNAVEITSTTAVSILNDKHKLYEFSRDPRREAIRQRQPLIITGTTNEQYNILAIREELEELGYETMMIFVNTSNESSRKRNEGHERMMAESVRQQRWEVTQLVAEKFNQHFKKYLEFDNSMDLNEANDFETSEKEEDISIIYEMTNWFFDIPVDNEIAESWMVRHKKHNINKMFENFITKPILEKGYKKYVSETKTNSKAVLAEGPGCACGDKTTSSGRTNQKSGSYKRYRIADNICPSCELVRRQGKPDDIKDGGITSNSSYIFRTYESSTPTITVKEPESETRFQQDNDKQKSKRQKAPGAEAGKVLKSAGVSPEYDTRGSGSVYPMSGLSNVNFKEQKSNKYTSTAEVTRKSFNKFRKESIDSPSTEMGVTGGEYGPSNKEPLETQLDKTLNQDSNIKKKKKK
jgi:predicted kinase